MSLGLGNLHMHKRKRATRKELEPFPSPSTLKRYLDYLMYVVALSSPLALVPQVYQIFLTHQVSGLALPTWILLAAGNVLWGVYGVVHREMPIIIGNVALAFLNSAVILGIFLYQ